MQLGDHLVSSRIGYTHHGIYIGDNQVIHYSGSADEMIGGEIMIGSLDEFSIGNDIRVKGHTSRKYSREESILRAHSRLGERWYNPLLNNCEHFVNWCILGIHSSSQVNTLVVNVAAAPVAMKIAQAGRQTATAMASVASTTPAKSVAVSTASGLTCLATTGAVGTYLTGTGATTVLLSGLVAGPVALPAAATIAVSAGVLGAKQAFDWIWD